LQKYREETEDTLEREAIELRGRVVKVATTIKFLTEADPGFCRERSHDEALYEKESPVATPPRGKIFQLFPK
jgi:hypothetical protein